MGAEVGAVGDVGNFLERGFVQVQARVEAEQAWGATGFGVGADTDGVDAHAFLGRQASGCQRVNLPAVVGTVRDQHQHPALCRAFAQPFDRQANGVADGGVLAGDADLRLDEEGAHGAPVKGERRLQVGLAAEQDQAHTVAFTVLQEVAHQRLDQVEAADVLVLPLHVGEVHRPGHVHRHQQVAAAGGDRHRFAQPLRASGGAQQQQPDDDERCLLAPGGQVEPCAAPGQAFQLVEEAHLEHRFTAVGGGQQQAHQPWQRQQGEDPRPGQFKHACGSRFRRLG
ncbi:hypothetical protein D9M71_484980 [compost metagenome]